ncbi:hypothetical protein [Streptomyces sp. NPDC057748]|uniref:hypothetical protein n=1 Tax=unclassified Streptomyces TaxID=2593676 RepID=UPI00369C71B9
MEDSVIPNDLVAVDLVPRPVLHGAQDDQPERGVFYLGRPFTSPLDLETAPEHIRSYAAEKHSEVEFRRLVVNLSLSPKAGEPIRHITVNAAIDADNGSKEPLFRDASPLRLTKAVTRSSKVGVKTDFGVVKPEAERGSQYEREEPFLLARGIGTNSVQWEFRQTPGQALDGSHELLATLELPVGATGSILLSAAVSIRRKRLGIIGYDARLPQDIAVMSFR